VFLDKNKLKELHSVALIYVATFKWRHYRDYKLTPLPHSSFDKIN